MNKKAKKKNPLKLKACAVALSLWGLSSVLALYSSPVMAADTASNRESQLEQKVEEFMAKVMKDPASKKMTAQELQNVMAFLFSAGSALVDSHHYEEALATFNYLIKRFGNSHDPKIQAAVGLALCKKGVVLGNLHRYEEAIAAYNDLITRFGNSQDQDIQEDVAFALYNKGVALDNLDRYEEAIAAYNDLITRFGNSQDQDIQEDVAFALYNKGVDLGRLLRIGQARADWEELVYRFKDNPDVDIQKTVAQARHILLVTRNF